MIAGNIVGTISFTGAYKIDASKVCFSIKGIVLFTLAKKTKITLKITTLFRRAKTPPNILLISPSATKSAIFVKTFPREDTAITMAIKVTANAVNAI
jgi:hypothetical protein